MPENAELITVSAPNAKNTATNAILSIELQGESTYLQSVSPGRPLLQ